MAPARTLHALLLSLLFAVAINPPAAADDALIVARVVEPYIELHTGPGRGYPIFYIAERGESVTVLKQRTDWIKVRGLPSRSSTVSARTRFSYSLPAPTL